MENMLWCKDGGEVDVEGWGRLSVHDGLLDVAWFCVCKLSGSSAGDECKSGGTWVKVRVRWKTEGLVWKLSDSYDNHAMHEVNTYVWGWRNITWICYCDLMRWRNTVIWRMFAFFGLSQYFDQGSSAFFSCALTVNVISLLFLQQWITLFRPSMKTSISGTSRKLPICLIVSNNVHRRKTWRDVKSCYCGWRVQSGDWVVREVLKNAGDWVYSLGPLTTYVVCDKRWYFYEISLWDACWPLSQARLFQNSRC